MFTPKTNYAKIAFDAVLFFVSTGEVRKVAIDKISADLKLKMACMVSIFDSKEELLGRYGRVKPKNEILYDEIIENAVEAAQKNGLKSLKGEQLNQIKVYVDVLSALHRVENMDELKPNKHGLFIKDDKGNSGFIMPGREGVKTVAKQIEIIKNEYNIQEKDKLKLEIWYFKSTRYD